MSEEPATRYCFPLFYREAQELMSKYFTQIRELLGTVNERLLEGSLKCRCTHKCYLSPKRNRLLYFENWIAFVKRWLALVEQVKMLVRWRSSDGLVLIQKCSGPGSIFQCYSGFLQRISRTSHFTFKYKFSRPSENKFTLYLNLWEQLVHFVSIFFVFDEKMLIRNNNVYKIH